MRVSLVGISVALSVFGVGCISSSPKTVIKTQVVTMPDGALVEFNGQPKGRAPAQIIFPQDEYGRLTERAVVRVLPNTDQPTLYAQNRIYEPGDRIERVPDRIMVDMTLRGTNSINAVATSTTHVERDTEMSARPPVPYINRGKPTQAVGLDRWKPGIY